MILLYMFPRIYCNVLHIIVSFAEAYPGLVVGTGVEDYFDSGFHWSHMLPGGRYPIYHGEDAGLTHFNHNPDPLKQGEAPCSGDSPPGLGAYGDCHLSAYKLHHHDHVMFSKASGGMKLE